MAFKPASLPRGLNFTENRWLAHEQADDIGFCDQCGREYKAAQLMKNKLETGHAVCFPCLKRLRDGHTDTTEDDLLVGEETGEMPWMTDPEHDKTLPF